MGVPKFFRFFAERYPCISELTDGDGLSTVDNLYLDMNGIIHVCSHDNKDLLRGNLQTHDDMVRSMLCVIEKLFNAVKPRKHFLMCIDGVAPRAKMNQQRQRRFRAAEELQLAAAEAKAKGEVVNDPASVFDSNVITPGTPFMEKLDTQLRYFINYKIENDPLWRDVKILFSGHDVPGEGEHKIIEFMRNRRTEVDYNPNDTHCIYGLDADLIMLALASQESHVMLLRDIVKFETVRDTEKKEELRRKGIEREKLATPEQYVLLHMGVFKDYLSHDLNKRGRAHRKRSVNWNKVFNDFVIMCFLIGNDFLPCMPALSINDGAIPLLFQIYSEHLLDNGNYLTDDKTNICWASMQIFLREIGKLELQMTQEKEKNEREYQKRAMRADRDVALREVKNTTNIDDRKRDYYTKKLGFTQPGELNKMIFRWVEGIEWVWGYYTRGVPSWKYFFPYNYSPFASDIASTDIVNFAAQTAFSDAGSPFTPFQQLLGVLPPSSIKRCLPESFHQIPFNKDMEYAFPQNLSIDRENALAPWEGIVLIPFLKEEDILRYTEKLSHGFSEKDKARNKLRNPCFYTHKYDKGVPKVIASPLSGLPMLKVQVNCDKVEMKKKITPDPVHFNNNAVAQMGFGTLVTKRKIESYAKQRTVEIFGKPTYKDSIIIKLPGSDLLESYTRLTGTMVWIGYPHYKYARVMRIADRRKTVSGKNISQHTLEHQESFKQMAKDHQDRLLRMRGFATEVTVLIAVRHMTGLISVHNKTTTRLSSIEVWYPAQLLAPQDYKANHHILSSLEATRDLRTSIGTPVMYLPQNAKEEKFWGTTGAISALAEGKVLISLTPSYDYPVIPDSLEKRLDTSNWIPLADISRKSKLPLGQLIQICGSITTTKAFGSKELGLGLLVMNQTQYYGRLGFVRFSPEEARTPVEVGHYLNMGTRDVVVNRLIDTSNKTRMLKSPRIERGKWLVSPAGRDIILKYLRQFAPIITALDGEKPENFDPNRLRVGIWSDIETDNIISNIQAFITTVEYKKTPLVGVTEEVLPFDALEKLEETLMKTLPTETKETTRFKIQQQLNDVYTPLFNSLSSSSTVFLQPPQYETKETIRLGARVVNMKATGGIPFGARGTVVRLLGDGATVEVILDKVCLSGTTLGGRLKTHRGVLIKRVSLLPVRNIPAKKTEKQILTRSANDNTTTVVKGIIKREPQPESDDHNLNIAAPICADIDYVDNNISFPDFDPSNFVSTMAVLADHVHGIQSTLSKPAVDVNRFLKVCNPSTLFMYYLLICFVPKIIIQHRDSHESKYVMT